MNRHKTAFYTDGHFKVEYCTICSCEDAELSLPCCGEVIVKPRKKSAQEIADDKRDLIEIALDEMDRTS